MLKKLTHILPVLLAVLIVFTLVQSAPVQAGDPVYDEQVLIVAYLDRDQLADLAKRFDVVEVDSAAQTVKIFSNQITRDALAAAGFTWTVDQAYTTLINTPVKPLFGQTTGIPNYPCYRTLAEIYASADNLAANYQTWWNCSILAIPGKRPKTQMRVGIWRCWFWVTAPRLPCQNRTLFS